MARFRIGLGSSRELQPGIPVDELPYAWILMMAGSALGAWLTGSQSRLSILLGVPFLVLGGLLALAAIRTLGRAQDLVTSGPYRLVRHPYYLAILIMLVGAVIALRSWPGAVLLIPAVLVTVDRARREEHNLSIRFDDELDDYRREVPFLLPLRLSLLAPARASRAHRGPDDRQAPAEATPTPAGQAPASPGSPAPPSD